MSQVAANAGAGLMLNAIDGTPDGVNIHAATFTGRWTTNNATTGNTWTLRNGVAPNDLGGNGTAPSGPNNHNNIIAVGSNDYAVVQGMGVMVTTTADGGVNSYLPANSGLPVAAPFVRSLTGLFFTGGPCNAFYLPIDGLGLHKSTSPGHSRSRSVSYSSSQWESNNTYVGRFPTDSNRMCSRRRPRYGRGDM